MDSGCGFRKIALGEIPSEKVTRVLHEGGRSWASWASKTAFQKSHFVSRFMGQPVLDRTSLASKVNFYLETFSEVGNLATPPLETRSSAEIRSIIAELEKQAGIKLELSKEKIEVLTIDHIERPSEN